MKGSLSAPKSFKSSKGTITKGESKSAAANSLAVYITDKNEHNDECDIQRILPGTFTAVFVVTGQKEGRDNHFVLDAIRFNKRIVVFHREKSGAMFEYMGNAIMKEIIAAGTGADMKVVLKTKREADSRHMCGEHGDHLRFKKGALHSIGVDVEIIKNNFFMRCFVPFDS